MQPWFVLTGFVLLMITVIGMGFYCLTLFVVPITEDLGISRSSFSLIYTFSGIGSGIITVFLVRISKRISARTLGLTGGLMGACSYMIFARAFQRTTIYFVAVILGIATIFAGTAVAQIGLVPWFRKKQGFALGLVGASSGLGTAVFSPVIGAIISARGWRFTCWFEAALIAVTSVIAYVFFLRDTPEKLGMRPYGYEEETEPKEQGGKTQEASGTAFSDALRTSKFYIMFAGIFLVTISYQILSLHQSPMIQDKGFSLEEAARCLSVFAISNMCNKFIAGLIEDRFGIRAVCIYCSVAVAAAIACILYGATYFSMIAFSVLFGFWPAIIVLYGVFAGKFLFGEKESASWVSVGQFGICTGGLIAPWISGWLYDMRGNYSLLLYALLGTVVAFAILSVLLFRSNNKFRTTP